MKSSRFLTYIFNKVRGDSGQDRSRGPLSDRVREAATGILSGRGDPLVVEIGVGEGLLAEDVLGRGGCGIFVGMDVSPDMIKHAQRRMKNGRRFIGVCARGDRPPFKAGALSRVVCINMLHNQSSWSEVERIVSAVGDLIGEGGSFILDIRNARDPLIRSAYRFSTVFDPSTKVLPVRAYRLGEIRRLLTRHGFRIVREVGVYYPYWFFPSAYVIEALK